MNIIFFAYTKVKNTHYGKDDVSIKWYEDGTLNACVNCVDRHLADKGDQTAIIWEGDEPDQDAKITYQELHDEVCRFANVLKTQGVKKGDRVTIYMPMIPEASYAMLACARIGPSVSNKVLQVTQAQPKHGGAGAFYVYLRYFF